MKLVNPTTVPSLNTKLLSKSFSLKLILPVHLKRLSFSVQYFRNCKFLSAPLKSHKFLYSSAVKKFFAISSAAEVSFSMSTPFGTLPTLHATQSPQCDKLISSKFPITKGLPLSSLSIKIFSIGKDNFLLTTYRAKSSAQTVLFLSALNL